jgi:hypothetical protein
MSELRELAKPLEGTEFAFGYSTHPTPTSAKYVFQHTIVLSEAAARAEIEKCKAILAQRQG